ncbi:hypothetical protein E2C01_004565 [Portunus trituberculatus]|uniref:Uncharacterized protein n=1 Tax=Portunus trituberculatus TaxID=210409 RepID=A0A5B7CR12_PORTR|nr:hypothetical protein [Portunus trituberculatus]
MQVVLYAVHVAPLTGRCSSGRPGCPELCRCDAPLRGWCLLPGQDQDRSLLSMGPAGASGSGR